MKAKILKAVGENSMSIAAGLDKAEAWQKDDNKITLLFNSPFASTLIEKESRSIERILKDHLGWDITIVTDVKQGHSVQNDTVEEQVELFRTVFRGTIIK